MAKLFACCVFDVKVSAYQRPFFSPSVGAAVRAFGDEVLRPGSEMNAHPEDYQLYHVGAFLDDSGSLEIQAPPILLTKALDFVVNKVK